LAEVGVEVAFSMQLLGGKRSSVTAGRD
jgi:hypothetical protein